MFQPDWQPTASLENLKLRARILAEIRAFFMARGVLEVETPVLASGAATDPYLSSFECRYEGPLAPRGKTLYLQTSPEFHMKRLLAAGSGPIFQICKAFRNGEAGAIHNPEFTMLEWYRPEFNHLHLMNEVEDLVRHVLGIGPIARISYRQLFFDHVGIDPFTAEIGTLQEILRHRDLVLPELENATLDDWLALVMSHIIEPAMGDEALFVFDFPASQAMLARIRDDEPPVAERFELYYGGIELANGFHELADATQQRQRFEANLDQRRRQGLAEVAMDQYLLDALAAGLPDCAGVAMGVDRLVMLAAKRRSLADVVTFPLTRA